MNILRRSWIAVGLLVGLLASVIATAPGTQAAAAPPVSTLVAIRAAAHAAASPRYDRVVFEFSGPVPQIQIQYVKQLIGSASGLPVAISGNAILQLTMRPAQAHNDQSQTTAPTRMTLRLPTVKAIASAGDFEGVLTYGIGLTNKPEIRVITLPQPSRVVVDFITP